MQILPNGNRRNLEKVAGLGNELSLAEWSERYGIKPERHESGAVYVPQELDMEPYRDLYNLLDYKVSSVVAGTIWLMPSDPAFFEAAYRGEESPGAETEEAGLYAKSRSEVKVAGFGNEPKSNSI